MKIGIRRRQNLYYICFRCERFSIIVLPYFLALHYIRNAFHWKIKPCFSWFIREIWKKDAQISKRLDQKQEGLRTLWTKTGSPWSAPPWRAKPQDLSEVGRLNWYTTGSVLIMMPLMIQKGRKMEKFKMADWKNRTCRERVQCVHALLSPPRLLPQRPRSMPTTGSGGAHVCACTNQWETEFPCTYAVIGWLNFTVWMYVCAILMPRRLMQPPKNRLVGQR